MQVETLVTNIKQPELGIGCITKKLKVTYKVSFGMDMVMVCKPTELRIIDTTDNVPITKKELKEKRLSGELITNTCIMGNELFDFLNNKWLSRNTVVTPIDLKLFPRVKIF